MSCDIWPQYPLSKLVTIQSEMVSIDKLALISDVNLFSIPGFDLGEPERVSGNSIGSSKYKVPSDCILLSRLNPRIPRVWRVKLENSCQAFCSTEFWPLVTIDKDKLDLDYLSWFLRSALFLEHPSIQPSSTTKSHQRIDAGSLRRLLLPLPALAEQQKIASILFAVGQAADQTKAVILQLKALKSAVMQDLLTHGIPGKHQAFMDTKIGQIPAGWHVKSLGSICKLTSGGTPKRTEPKFWNGTIPWVKTAEIKFAEINATEEHITEYGLSKSSAKVLPAGTVVLAMYGQGTTRGRVGTLGIAAATNQACIGFLELHSMNSRFLYHLLEWSYPHLREMGHEGSQKNLSASLLSSYLVPVPAPEEQLAISAALDSIDARRSAEIETLNALLKAKEGLITALLSGEIRAQLDESPL